VHLVCDQQGRLLSVVIMPDLRFEEVMDGFRARSQRWQVLKRLEASLPEDSPERAAVERDRRKWHGYVMDAINEILLRPEVRHVHDEGVAEGVRIVLLKDAQTTEGE
jgi:hypothetical protein